MCLRGAFVSIGEAKQGMGGNMNDGINLVRHCASSQDYIEKRIPRDLIMRGHAEREIRSMQKVTQRNGIHPNIVFVKDHDMNIEHLNYGSIFMQYCELGSLDMLMMRYMDQKQTLADEGFIWKVLWDISLALCYLWTGKDDASTRKLAKQAKSAPIHDDWSYIVHCDLKPSNIFLTWADHPAVSKGSRYPTAVLGDFGCSVSQDDIKKGLGCYGDKEFEAPEAPYASHANDVYGLGLIIHCLGTMRSTPYHDATILQKYPFLGNLFFQGLENLVGKCLSENPSERPMPQDLPKLVWSSFLAWRVGRNDAGALLPNWACAPSC